MPASLTIIHKPSGEIIAQGPKGWGMFQFEGNVYMARRHMKTEGFSFSGIPGICPYKFIYFWYHFKSRNGTRSPMLGWKYWLPNPLFPFIAFRIAVPLNHPEITVKESQ